MEKVGDRLDKQEDFWRNIINHSDAPDLPDTGGDPPKLEQIIKEPIKDGESPVFVQKIITEMYVYTSMNQSDLWYGAQTIQDVQVLGLMRLSEAQKLINGAKRKRRRK